MELLGYKIVHWQWVNFQFVRLLLISNSVRLVRMTEFNTDYISCIYRQDFRTQPRKQSRVIKPAKLKQVSGAYNNARVSASKKAKEAIRGLRRSSWCVEATVFTDYSLTKTTIMSSRAEKARSTGRRRVHPPTRSRAVALFLRFIVYLLFSFRESAAAAASRSRHNNLNKLNKRFPGALARTPFFTISTAP